MRILLVLLLAQPAQAVTFKRGAPAVRPSINAPINAANIKLAPSVMNLAAPGNTPAPKANAGAPLTAEDVLKQAAELAAAVPQAQTQEAETAAGGVFDQAQLPKAEAVEAPQASKCPFHKLLGLNPSSKTPPNVKNPRSVPRAKTGLLKFSIWRQVKHTAGHYWQKLTGKDAFHGNKRPPQVRSWEIAKLAMRHVKNPVGGLEAIHAEHGDVAYAELAGHRAFFIADPALIGEILINTDKNEDSPFEKSELGIGGIAKLTGRHTTFLGLRDVWKQRRDAVQPHVGIRPATRESMADTVLNGVDLGLDELATRAWNGREVSVSDEMSAITMKVILKALFNYDESTERLMGSIGPAFQEIVKTVPLESLNPLSARISDIPLLYPRRKQLKGAYRTLDLFAESILRTKNSPLLDSLKAAGLTEREIKNEILTLILAGHETTSATVTWTLHELKRDPETFDRLIDEIETSQGRDVRAAIADGRYPFLDQILTETLRLYTPAYVLFRRAKTDVQVGDVFIPKGSHVFLSTFVMHRRPQQWDKTGYPAGEFHPERFDEDNVKSRGLSKKKDLATYPFGHGPRVCMGMALSMLEAKMLIIRFVERFELQALRGRAPKITSDIGVKLDDAFPAVIRPR